jgi:hypothetical protein
MPFHFYRIIHRIIIIFFTQGRTMDSLLSEICTVGRTSFAEAARHVCNSLAASLQDAEKLLQLQSQLQSQLQQGSGSASTSMESVSRDSVRILESLRIGVLFVSHLCIDDFQGDVSVSASSDTPTIPPFVLDAFAQGRGSGQGGVQGGAQGGAEMSSLLHQQISLIASILRVQMHVLSSSAAHPLLSPLLIQNLFHFFAEYAVRYFDADTSLYSVRTLQEVPMLFTLHGKQASTHHDLCHPHFLYSVF